MAKSEYLNFSFEYHPTRPWPLSPRHEPVVGAAWYVRLGAYLARLFKKIKAFIIAQL